MSIYLTLSCERCAWTGCGKKASSCKLLLDARSRVDRVSSAAMTRHAGLDSLCGLQFLFALLLGLCFKSLSCADAAYA